MVHSSYKNTFNSVFSPYIIRFLETKEATGANVESFIHPLREFDRFAIYANLTSTSVKQTDFELWRNYITGKTASTIYHKFCIVGQFLRYMARLGIQCYIPIYPRKPKNHYVPYIFSKDELDKIFKNADELCFIRRDFHSHIFVIPVLLRILYSTGMRIGEALVLDYTKDIDLEKGILFVRRTQTKDTSGKSRIGDSTKTFSGQRIINLNAISKMALEEAVKHIIPNKFHLLFYNSTNKKYGLYEEASINSALKRAGLKLNIGIYEETNSSGKKVTRTDIHTHMLRGTFATRCAEAKIDPNVLKEILGHSDTSITMKYYIDIDTDFIESENQNVVNYLINKNIFEFAK